MNIHVYTKHDKSGQHRGLEGEMSTRTYMYVYTKHNKRGRPRGLQGEMGT